MTKWCFVAKKKKKYKAISKLDTTLNDERKEKLRLPGKKNLLSCEATWDDLNVLQHTQAFFVEETE